MAEYKTDKQVNYGFPLTFNAAGKFPIIAKRIWNTYAEALAWVNDVNEAAVAGLQLSVINDEDAKKNGVYFVAKIGTGTNDAELVKVGDGSGSEAVANYEAALAAATADNLGQILYVTNPTYKKDEGTTLNPDEADVDEEGNKIVVYTAGPYIVTGAGAVAKLGTTSATGDIAGDVENLKGRVSTAENEIDALQTAVGNAESGLVKDVADLQNLLDEESGRIDANETAVTELRSAVQGGVHFRGVYEKLPELSIDEEGIVTGSYTDSEGLEHSYTFNTGDVIIVAYYDEASDHPITEPTKEYILAYDGEGYDSYTWVELGDVTAEGQRISALESLIDSDKATAWTTGANQAATLTANIDNYALKTEVAEGYVAKETNKNLVSDTLIAKLDGLANIKSVDTNSVLSVNADGALTADLGGYVAKDGDKVLSTNDFTNDLKAKLDGIAANAQVNVIETIKVNGSTLTADVNKAVDIDLVNHLAGKVSINGQVLAETNDDGVLAAVVDASDIHLGANIGDHAAESTTVQGMLSTVYEIANSKIGSIYLAKDDTTTANVLTLSKTNATNDTIAFKIAADSALKATTNGLDLVWTEL